jgi:hypothetical protein
MVRHWDGADIPCHYKLSLKFFPNPIEVTPASTLAAKTTFRNGESDWYQKLLDLMHYNKLIF